MGGGIRALAHVGVPLEKQAIAPSVKSWRVQLVP